MHRRSFIKLAGSLGVVAPFVRLETTKSLKANSWLQILDAKVPALLEQQEKNPAHRWVGGVRDAYGIHNAPETGKFIRHLAGVYCESQSRYFHDPALLAPLQAAINYFLKTQHRDGSIDLHTTNFNSPPDTGFVIENLCLAYTLLQREPVAQTGQVRTGLQNFMLHAANCLCQGGVHTPNHRWVISMALSRLYALFPDNAYLQRIDQWLQEGIDIDADGQFNEKSSAIYSPLTDRCLITMARLLHRPELFEPVRRNLDMTLFYIHPDGEIVTEASRRQDQYQRGSLAPYYYPYRYMALLDQNGQYAAMTKLIEKTGEEKLADDWIFFQEDAALKKELPKEQPLPDSYSRVFSHSQLARIRRGDVSATILAQNPTLFAFHKNNAALEAVRLASAFFGKGQFSGQTLVKEGDAFIMTHEAEGPYFQPFSPDQVALPIDWNKTSRELRKKSEIQHLQSQVRIVEKNGRFELSFTIKGTDDVPVAIELAFRKGGKLSGVEPVNNIADAFLLTDGMGSYQFEENEISFGPGQAEHRWTQLRGSLPKMNSLSVYITGYTPFEYTLKICQVRANDHHYHFNSENTKPVSLRT